jgi:predicted ABC-type ATPase
VITPRLRVIAGPNGSGKTTLTRFLRQTFNFSFGYYINADDIQLSLTSKSYFDFSDFELNINEEELKGFFKSHALNIQSTEMEFSVSGNRLHTSSIKTNGYFSAILSDFIRQQLLKANVSFSFETVMSSNDKVQLLADAHALGYRNYLYYICTDDVLINKERIISRVSMGEHNVPPNKIESRYIRSLDLLLNAIKLTDRAYIFDNSGKSHELIAEVTGGKQLRFNSTEWPDWFQKSVIEKILL